MPEYLDQISHFVVKTNFADFDTNVIEQAKKVVYDIIGAIAVGAQQKEPMEMVKKIGAFFGASKFHSDWSEEKNRSLERRF